MAKSHEITLLLTSDGSEWGKFLTNNLDSLREQVTHRTLFLDRFDYENPAEVTQACLQSPVILVLATPDMLTYMSEKAGWLSHTLWTVPASSDLAVIVLMDKEAINDVIRNAYATSRWKFFDPGTRLEDVQQMVASILDILEQSCQRKAVEARDTPGACKPRAAAKLCVKVFPSTVYEPGVKVALVFKDGVDGDVMLKMGNTEKPVVTTKLNSCVYTFYAPEISPGKHSVTVTADGRTQRVQLTYSGVETAALTSVHYLCQCLGVPTAHELDLRLRDIFIASLPDDNVVGLVFKRASLPDSADFQKNANSLYPTLLHFAAANGLAEFCSALMECPGSSRAYRVRNCDGLDPADLAFRNDFEELGNYIIDFMEVQQVEDIYTHYVTLHEPPGGAGTGDEMYADMTGAFGRSPTLPPRSVPPLAPDPPSSPKPPKVPVPVRPASVDDAGHLKRTSSDRETSDRGSDRGSDKAATLPRRAPPPIPDPSAPNAAALFMGIGVRQNTPLLPQGALGSRTQSELIEIHEMVKSGEINLNEAQMLFNSWQQRCGRNTAISFKDRQKELEKIRQDILKQRKTSGKPDGDFFSRLLKRKSKESIRPNISEPVVPRQSKKSQVFSKPKAELPSPDRTSTASTGSSSSSRDSGWSVGSRDSSLSTSVDKDSDSEEQEDEFSSPANITRRSQSSRSSLTNRQSLGCQFLQQLHQSSGNEGPVPPPGPPPLPPPRRK